MRSFVAVLVLLGSIAVAEGTAPAPARAAPVAAVAPAPKTDGGAPAVKLDGAKLFMEKTCLACHGKDAKTPILPEYPRLAGQSALYAERQMKDIKAGVRNNGNTAAMKGIMVLVNEDEIHALAEYISTLR